MLFCVTFLLEIWVQHCPLPKPVVSWMVKWPCKKIFLSVSPPPTPTTNKYPRTSRHQTGFHEGINYTLAERLHLLESGLKLLHDNPLHSERASTLHYLALMCRCQLVAVHELATALARGTGGGTGAGTGGAPAGGSSPRSPLHHQDHLEGELQQAAAGGSTPAQQLESLKTECESGILELKRLREIALSQKLWKTLIAISFWHGGESADNREVFVGRWIKSLGGDDGYGAATEECVEVLRGYWRGRVGLHALSVLDDGAVLDRLETAKLDVFALFLSTMLIDDDEGIIRLFALAEIVGHSR